MSVTGWGRVPAPPGQITSLSGADTSLWAMSNTQLFRL
jgi:hypothetical protein